MLTMAFDFKIKYPKFLFLFLSFLFAYLILSNGELLFLRVELVNLGYFGTFLAGIFYAYGFTAGPASAVFLLNAKTQNILISGVVGGFGALIADFIIFKFIRYSFIEEIEMLSKEKFVVKIRSLFSPLMRKYLLPLIAAFVIASPLPDEIGVTMMAASRHISTKQFLVISYVLNTIGIFAILHIGKYV